MKIYFHRYDHKRAKFVTKVNHQTYLNPFRSLKWYDGLSRLLAWRGGGVDK